ncbi:UNVERIFIED_CONTAM: hypothetical protein FKN15_021734 [Acipenser sinensis]
MDPSVTLWQFLLHLLEDPGRQHLITWTSSDGEFKLLEAEEVARLWGLRKNKTNMNYDKLSRALRYYYDKKILKKVSGQKFVYKFVTYPDPVALETMKEEANRRENPLDVLKLPGSVGAPKSSRNDYMRSGLYSTFTIQSLQPASKPARTIKTESPQPSEHTPPTPKEGIQHLPEVGESHPQKDPCVSDPSSKLQPPGECVEIPQRHQIAVVVQPSLPDTGEGSQPSGDCILEIVPVEQSEVREKEEDRCVAF